MGRHLPLGFRTGHIGAEYVLLQGRMTPFFSMESTISCTGSYDAIGILYCRTKVGGAFGFVGMRTVWMFVNPQSRESLAKESLYFCRTSLSPWRSNFVVEGIRFTQDLLNLSIEPGVGFFCS